MAPKRGVSVQEQYDEYDARIDAAIRAGKTSASEIAAATNVHVSTVYNHLRIRPLSERRPARPPGKAQASGELAIRDALEANPGRHSVAEIAEMTGLAPAAVASTWGLAPPVERSPAPQDDGMPHVLTYAGVASGRPLYRDERGQLYEARPASMW